MAEEIKHINVGQKYRMVIERLAVKGTDGFKVEANGDELNIVETDASLLYEYAVKHTQSESYSKEPLSKDAQIERAVWIKELGECIRANDIDITKPNGLALRNAYYTEMCRVLGINIKEVSPTESSLIKEAEKLGAKEIRKEDK